MLQMDTKALLGTLEVLQVDTTGVARDTTGAATYTTGAAFGHYRRCRQTLQALQTDNTGAADGQYRCCIWTLQVLLGKLKALQTDTTGAWERRITLKVILFPGLVHRLEFQQPTFRILNFLPLSGEGPTAGSSTTR